MIQKKDTSGIFFSSTKAMETSAWEIINSTAPEPVFKSGRYYTRKTRKSRVTKKKHILGYTSSRASLRRVKKQNLII